MTWRHRFEFPARHRKRPFRYLQLPAAKKSWTGIRFGVRTALMWVATDPVPESTG